ncbi:alcohol dehydrogenase catalytic domain-containing protein [Amycolatopsis sp. 195334CR]|uniref:alcohol dehydrogenase catalytic domain-containing protein n=1 Tax=Amycolatopsis sp. 195334CR TaxID=2814588 RepID=UPI001A8FFE2D|nr:alcohol dehydrogenase catalytic domain-containing protein [Amycolatopsis sp. 195334CR]MBN6040577.1 alcohol dehydrogenase catalytic domain-containing protein [Amycolatopsis sp. 195334CR]
MRTSVLLSRGTGPSEVVEAELDDPRPDEVIVRIEAVGVCHTDLVTRRALGDRPAVLGHEGCGVVERLGAGVGTLAVGDRVVLSFASCGACAQCRAGQPAYCGSANALNNSGARPDGSPTIRVDGEPVFGAFFGQSSFAEAAVVAARSCVRVGDLAPEIAAPLGCGFLTGAGAVLNALRPVPGDRLLVVGGGGVGAAAMLTALSEGVEVVVAEPVAARRELAGSLGAKAVASLDEPIPPVTHTLDTTGRPELIARVLDLLAPRGVLALVGLGPREATLDVRSLMLRGLQLRGCVEGDAEPAVLVPELARRYRDGRLPLDRLVTAYPLAEYDRAVADQRAGRVLKPVLVPSRPGCATRP